MDKVIIDTSAWIESFRSHGNEKIRYLFSVVNGLVLE